MKLSLDSLPKRVCSCGCDLFIPVANIREVSAIMSPNGQDGVVFCEAGFVCLDCNTPADTTIKPASVFFADGGVA